jgi:histone H3
MRYHTMHPASKQSDKAINHVPASAMNAVHSSAAKKIKPGSRALKEIKKYQSHHKHGVEMPIRKAPFQRLVSEDFANGNFPKGIKWQAAAVDALRDESEAYLVGIFEDAILEAIHEKRITVMPKLGTLTAKDEARLVEKKKWLQIAYDMLKTPGCPVTIVENPKGYIDKDIQLVRRISRELTNDGMEACVVKSSFSNEQQGLWNDNLEIAFAELQL